jgi:urease accessory protein
VRAARETVSTVSGGTLLDRLRAAYHLGNRHVPLQVAEDWLRYLHDHVLDDLVRRMGLQVAIEEAPFEPEAGAYGGGNTHAH